MYGQYQNRAISQRPHRALMFAMPRTLMAGHIGRKRFVRAAACNPPYSAASLGRAVFSRTLSSRLP